MANRKVRMKACVAGSDFVLNPGKEATINEKWAKELVDNDLAEYVTKPKEQVEKPKENADQNDGQEQNEESDKELNEQKDSDEK